MLLGHVTERVKAESGPGVNRTILGLRHVSVVAMVFDRYEELTWLPIDINFRLTHFAAGGLT